MQDFWDAVLQAFAHAAIAAVHNACDLGSIRKVHCVLMDPDVVVRQRQALCSTASALRLDDSVFMSTELLWQMACPTVYVMLAGYRGGQVGRRFRGWPA